MKRITKVAMFLLAGLVVIGLVLAGLFSILLSSFDTGPEEDSFRHEVEYTLELRTNGTLNESEIIAPYPEDQRFQKAVTGNASNISIVNQMNASLSIENTTKGEMIKLNLGNFTPETRKERFGAPEKRAGDRHENSEVVERNISGLNNYVSYNLNIKAKYNRSIDTKNGLENEPHLKSTKAQCESPYAGDCATTEAWVSYNTSNKTHTELDVRLNGRNSWWNLGWSGNAYSQRFYNSFYDDKDLVGSQDRWIVLTGREEEGDGTYR